jgi:hypothetical protein
MVGTVVAGSVVRATGGAMAWLFPAQGGPPQPGGGVRQCDQSGGYGQGCQQFWYTPQCCKWQGSQTGLAQPQPNLMRGGPSGQCRYGGGHFSQPQHEQPQQPNGQAEAAGP